MAVTDSNLPELIYYDSQGNEINADGTPKTNSGGSSGGWLGSLFGAIPGILSSLFPNGVGGGGNNTPIVTTNPYGQTTVTTSSNSNLLIIALVLMAGYIFLMQGAIGPAKPKRRR